MEKNKNSISLSKFLADAGIAARRKATELIKSGLVTVNDKVISEPGHKLNCTDIIKYNNKIVKPADRVYILLNKPRNYISTVSDERGRNTILDLIKLKTNVRLYPVGRLDRNTTGLILITNDGDLSQKLSHPRHKVSKTYHVTLDRPVEAADLDKIRRGLRLRDGIIKTDRVYAVQGTKKHSIVIELHSGKNRIVRRIFEHLGYKIKKLDRIKYARLTKKNLICGSWRILTKKEVEQLKLL